MYAHYHKSYKYSQTMTLVRKLRVHPCSKSLLEVCENLSVWYDVGLPMGSRCAVHTNMPATGDVWNRHKRAF